MSETIMIHRNANSVRNRTPSVAAALVAVSAITEALKSLSSILPAGGLALIISEVLRVLGGIVSPALASRAS